jgi:hypothetical protein
MSKQRHSKREQSGRRHRFEVKAAMPARKWLYFFLAACISDLIRKRSELILIKPSASAWL